MAAVIGCPLCSLPGGGEEAPNATGLRLEFTSAALSEAAAVAVDNKSAPAAAAAPALSVWFRFRLRATGVTSMNISRLKGMLTVISPAIASTLKRITGPALAPADNGAPTTATTSAAAPAAGGGLDLLSFGLVFDTKLCGVFGLSLPEVTRALATRPILLPATRGTASFGGLSIPKLHTSLVRRVKLAAAAAAEAAANAALEAASDALLPRPTPASASANQLFGSPIKLSNNSASNSAAATATAAAPKPAAKDAAGLAVVKTIFRSVRDLCTELYDITINHSPPQTTATAGAAGGSAASACAVSLIRTHGFDLPALHALTTDAEVPNPILYWKEWLAAAADVAVTAASDAVTPAAAALPFRIALHSDSGCAAAASDARAAPAASPNTTTGSGHFALSIAGTITVAASSLLGLTLDCSYWSQPPAVRAGLAVPPFTSRLTVNEIALAAADAAVGASSFDIVLSGSTTAAPTAGSPLLLPLVVPLPFVAGAAPTLSLAIRGVAIKSIRVIARVPSPHDRDRGAAVSFQLQPPLPAASADPPAVAVAHAVAPATAMVSTTAPATAPATASAPVAAVPAQQNSSGADSNRLDFKHLTLSVQHPLPLPPFSPVALRDTPTNAELNRTPPPPPDSPFLIDMILTGADVPATHSLDKPMADRVQAAAINFVWSCLYGCTFGVGAGPLSCHNELSDAAFASALHALFLELSQSLPPVWSAVLPHVPPLIQSMITVGATAPNRFFLPLIMTGPSIFDLLPASLSPSSMLVGALSRFRLAIVHKRAAGVLQQLMGLICGLIRSGLHPAWAPLYLHAIGRAAAPFLTFTRLDMFGSPTVQYRTDTRNDPLALYLTAPSAADWYRRTHGGCSSGTIVGPYFTCLTCTTLNNQKLWEVCFQCAKLHTNCTLSLRGVQTTVCSKGPHTPKHNQLNELTSAAPTAGGAAPAATSPPRVVPAIIAEAVKEGAAHPPAPASLFARPSPSPSPPPDASSSTATAASTSGAATTAAAPAVAPAAGVVQAGTMSMLVGCPYRGIDRTSHLLLHSMITMKWDAADAFVFKFAAPSAVDSKGAPAREILPGWNQNVAVSLRHNSHYLGITSGRASPGVTLQIACCIGASRTDPSELVASAFLFDPSHDLANLFVNGCKHGGDGQTPWLFPYNHAFPFMNIGATVRLRMAEAAGASAIASGIDSKSTHAPAPASTSGSFRPLAPGLSVRVEHNVDSIAPEIVAWKNSLIESTTSACSVM